MPVPAHPASADEEIRVPRFRSVPPPVPASRRPGSLEPTGGFEEFVAEAGDSLFRLAVLLSSDVAAGEDLYQETLLRAATHWAGIDHPPSWARRVMHNLAIDRARARRARPPEVPAPPGWAGFAAPGVGDQMAAAEVRDALLRALADLSEVQRLVVALRFLEDRSEADVAELLDAPVGTIKSTTSRAVRRLRNHPALRHLLPPEEASA